MKILTIVGTRPEIIRLSRIIPKLDLNYKHILVHTGQNYDYELNKIFFEDLDIREPDYILDLEVSSPAEAIGTIIIKIDKILEEENPDAVLILGDTNSCLASISAKRRKIPIFHMEAGNRCFDLRVPEEINRRIIDHCADINLTYSSIAREYLIQEGLPPDMIIKIGSPMAEVLNYYSDKIHNSNILESLDLNEYSFFLISAHREENIDDNLKFNQFISMLNFLSENYNQKIIVSTHPRTRKRINENKIILDSNINLINPLSFTDYNKLQITARATLSDSGTINEESSILNFPALNIRDSHERPEAMEEASVMMVGFNIDNIKEAINILDDQSRGETRTLLMADDYKDQNVSDKIVRIILSYKDYVNRKIWFKY